MKRRASRTIPNIPLSTILSVRKIRTTTGFTIVELLIVVVVIAILATITITAYNGISNRARTSAASSAAQQAAKKVLVYAATNSDQMPSNLLAAGVANQGDTTYQYRSDSSLSPQTFCITATANNISYFVNNTNQTSPAAGACPGHGANGATTITNLMTNPSAEVDTAGVFSSGAVTLATSTDWASSGTKSFKLSNTSTSNQGDLRLLGSSQTSFPLNLQPGGTYTVSARVRIPVSLTGSYDRTPGVLYWYSTDGATYVQSFGPKTSITAGTYLTSYTFTIPANATGISLGFGAASSTANQVVYYDSIMVTAGSTQQNFADGSSPGWAWNGAANNASSSGPAL